MIATGEGSACHWRTTVKCQVKSAVHTAGLRSLNVDEAEPPIIDCAGPFLRCSSLISGSLCDRGQLAAIQHEPERFLNAAASMICVQSDCEMNHHSVMETLWPSQHGGRHRICGGNARHHNEINGDSSTLTKRVRQLAPSTTQTNPSPGQKPFQRRQVSRPEKL